MHGRMCVGVFVGFFLKGMPEKRVTEKNARVSCEPEPDTHACKRGMALSSAAEIGRRRKNVFVRGGGAHA